MLGSVIRKNRLQLSLCIAIIGCVSTLSAPAYAQSSTNVNAVICAASSSITIDEPLSDSVVTDATVVVKGKVDQASQIEVKIDGQYDSVVPLDVGQKTYTTTIQMEVGTHTLTFKAIDSCGTNDASASSVVTYTPPPATSSDGSATDTAVESEQGSGGVTISGAGDTLEQKNNESILPRSLTDAWDSTLKWLNITPYDSADENTPRLSIARALTIAVGMYLATIGLATTVVSLVASSPIFSYFNKGNRYLFASRAFRIIGVLMLLAGFFL